MSTLHDRLVAELVAEVERRKALAVAATPGPWWDSPVTAAPGHHTIRGGPDDWRGFDGSLGGDTRPIARVEPAPDDEGGHVTNHDADATFIAAHDPADALRRYERDLKTLARHHPVGFHHMGSLCAGCSITEGGSVLRFVEWPCDEAFDLAAALGVEVSDG